MPIITLKKILHLVFGSATQTKIKGFSGRCFLSYVINRDETENDEKETILKWKKM